MSFKSVLTCVNDISVDGNGLSHTTIKRISCIPMLHNKFIKHFGKTHKPTSVLL